MTGTLKMKFLIVQLLFGIFNPVYLNANISVVRKSERVCQAFMNRFDTRNEDARTIFYANGTVQVNRPVYAGTNTTRGDFPHMAALGWKNNERIEFKCGGSIISERFILTAAHCITGTRQNLPSVVRVGDSNLQALHMDDGIAKIDPKISSIKDFAIQWLIKHPSYSSKTKENDIGLIKVSKEIEFNNFVLPACLQQNNNFDPRVKATGWGRTHYFGDTSNILLEGNLTIIKNDDCFEKLGEELELIEIYQSQICAENIDGTDTCQGDSGGPLQNKKSQHYIEVLEIKEGHNETIRYFIKPKIFNIIGITSFGGICGSGMPGIYTRIPSYLDWIEGIVWRDEQTNWKIHFKDDENVVNHTRSHQVMN